MATAATCQAELGCTTQAVGAVGDGWILPRKHSNSMENIAQISSSCYGASVHFHRKILLRYSSCTDQSIFIFFFNLYHFLSPANIKFCKTNPCSRKPPCSAHSSLPGWLKAHISIFDFTQFILLSHITVPKHFPKVSIHKLWHEQDKDK